MMYHTIGTYRSFDFVTRQIDSVYSCHVGKPWAREMAYFLIIGGEISGDYFSQLCDLRAWVDSYHDETNGREESP
jgi:hypothetical protein